MNIGQEESKKIEYCIIDNNFDTWAANWRRDFEHKVITPISIEPTLSNSYDVEATLFNEEKNGEIISKPLRYPIVTIPMFFLNWISFFIGVFFIIKWENANLSLTGPISPPISDTKYGELSRINSHIVVIPYYFSYYLIVGISHLGGNTLIGVLYGSLIEIYYPCGHLAVLLIYQLSIVLGALGHSLIWPYRGMIGCSPGVYGLFGGCFTLILFNKARIDNDMIFYSTLGILITQLIVDIISYHFFYLDGVSSAGHAFGFYTGVCLGLTFGLFYVKEIWKKGFAIIGCFGLILEISYLYTHFYSNWPPEAYQQPFLHNKGSKGCCNQLLNYVGQYNKNELEKMTYCSGDNMYFN